MVPMVVVVVLAAEFLGTQEVRSGEPKILPESQSLKFLAERKMLRLLWLLLLWSSLLL